MGTLGTTEADLYDWAEVGPDEGETQLDAARPGYRQVVAELRRQIFADGYPPDTALPGQVTLSRSLDADVAVINRAFGALAAEGLVTVEHGKRTIVRPRHMYSVSAFVPWRAGELPQAKVNELETALREAAGAHPAIRVLAVTLAYGGAQVVMSAEMPDAAYAVALAGAAIRAASHEDWDLSGVSVSAVPA